MNDEIDMVNHPPHYNNGPATCDKCGDCIECIEVTRHMPFSLGNAVKYLWRWDHKGGLEDLKKARWYLEDHIKEMERRETEKVKDSAKTVIDQYSGALKGLSDK